MTEKQSILYGILLLWIFRFQASNGFPACESDIWCQGRLLHDVQMADLYPDSKTFVDMNIKVDPDVVVSAYTNLSSRGTPTKAQLKSFIDTYFEGPGMEFEKWTPTDYIEKPAFLNRVNDSKLRDFGYKLCQIWSHLGRKIKPDVRIHQDRYSLIYLKNPFIVPGGRFREIYYWDSYWVVKGLLTCGMKSTVKGMLENLISFIPRYGLVPNGGRIYYTRRSQPPFLTPMVDAYMHATVDVAFLKANIGSVMMEYEFWNNQRTVMIDNKTKLYRYGAPITTPRPESFKEDFELGTNITPEKQRTEFYSNIASAAESGWDFSTRWFSRDFKKYRKSSWLEHIATKDVVPVDLNSILCSNRKILSNFYKMLGNQTASDEWNNKYQEMVDAVASTFWDNTEGAWFDYRIGDKSKNDNFYPSNLFPLFAGCLHLSEKDNYVTRTVRYLKNAGVLDYKSGIPTSLTNSGQQWDFPNAWPPLQHAVIVALANSKGESRQMALQLAQEWVESNYKGWARTGKMFEKYVVTLEGSRGGGGEYDVQEGFGWTNGVILDLLDIFGTELQIQGSTNNTSATAANKITLVLVFSSLLVTLFMGDKP